VDPHRGVDDLPTDSVDVHAIASSVGASVRRE
jgi:hypothetical protein